MKGIAKALSTWVLFIFLSFHSRAQPAPVFHEGMLTYRADTVRRLGSGPAAYIATRMVVYQKGDLIRIEVWRVNRFNPTDTAREIHLRNQQGIYTWIESSDTKQTAVGNFALFTSYEEEKQDQIKMAITLYLKSYSVETLLQKLPWLALPAERLALKNNTTQEPLEAIVTNAITIPVGSVFSSVRNLPGTPLQFTDRERGWATRFTATALTIRPVGDRLFEVDSTRKLMNTEEIKQAIYDLK